LFREVFVKTVQCNPYQLLQWQFTVSMTGLKGYEEVVTVY